jgi:uncharacterized membrane protein
MTFFALGVAAYAGAMIATPGIRPPLAADLFRNTPAAAFGHMAGGLIAIAVGAFQVSASLRDRYLNAHRWLGRLYVAGVLIGGVSAFALATRSTGGLTTHVGFGMLAVCWLTSTGLAWSFIRRGDETSHRAWMLRSYGLTLAAVTLRIWLPLSQVAGIEFETAYQAIAWLCWVPNLLVVEWLILSRTQSIAVPGRDG